MNRLRTLMGVGIVLLVTLIAVACGSDKKEAVSPTSEAQATATGQAEVPAEATAAGQAQAVATSTAESGTPAEAVRPGEGAAPAEEQAAVEPAAVPEAQPPAAPVEEVAPAVLPDRASCDEIRGTDYRSDAERDWFLANCAAAPAPEAVSPQPPAAPVEAPVGPQPVPPRPAPTSAADEAAYRNKASAQLAAFLVQLHQLSEITNPQQGRFILLQFAGSLQSLASTMDGLEPVPSRFRGVHNELRASALSLRQHILTIDQVQTEEQAEAFAYEYVDRVYRFAWAIDSFNRVVGTQLPTLD